MKHLCKNCIYCEKLLKAGFKYTTYCEKTDLLITKRVKLCKQHEKKYLTANEGFDKLLQDMKDCLEILQKDRDKGND